jgi:hypothetical protein
VQQNVELRIENMRLRKALEAKWTPRATAAEFVPSQQREKDRQRKLVEDEEQRRDAFVACQRSTSALNQLFQSEEAQRLAAEAERRRLEAVDAEQRAAEAARIEKQQAEERACAERLILLCFAEDYERSLEPLVQGEVLLEHIRLEEAIAEQVRWAEATAKLEQQQRDKSKELAEQENRRASEEARRKKKQKKRAEAQAERERQAEAEQQRQRFEADLLQKEIERANAAQRERERKKEVEASKLKAEALKVKAEAELKKEELRAKAFEEERQERLRRSAQKAEQHALRVERDKQKEAQESNERLVAKITREVDPLDLDCAWAVYYFSIDRGFGKIEDERSRRFVKSLIQLKKTKQDEELLCKLRMYWIVQRIEVAKKKTPIAWIENMPMTSNLAEYLASIFKDPRCSEELALRTATHYLKSHTAEHSVKFFITWALVPNNIPLAKLLLQAAKPKPDVRESLWSLCWVNDEMLHFYIAEGDRFECYESKMVKALQFSSPLDHKIIDLLTAVKPTNRYFVLKVVFQLFRKDLERDLCELLLTCLHEVLVSQEEFRKSMAEHKERLMETAETMTEDLVPLLMYCCLLLSEQ